MPRDGVANMTKEIMQSGLLSRLGGDNAVRYSWLMWLMCKHGSHLNISIFLRCYSDLLAPSFSFQPSSRFCRGELGRMIRDFASISGVKDMLGARLCGRLRSRQTLVRSLSTLELAFDKVLPSALRYTINYGFQDNMIKLYPPCFK